MRSLFVVVVALVLASCATTMSPEQMAQNVKDKNAVIGCAYGLGIYGRGGAVYVDTNKINDNQTVNVDAECKVSVTGTKGAASSVKTP